MPEHLRSTFMRFKMTLLSASLATGLLLSGWSSNMTSSAEAAAPDAKQNGGFLSKILPEQKQPVTIPAGTPVTVRLHNSISSASANPGDAFEFTLVEPL